MPLRRPRLKVSSAPFKSINNCQMTFAVALTDVLLALLDLKAIATVQYRAVFRTAAYLAWIPDKLVENHHAVFSTYLRI